MITPFVVAESILWLIGIFFLFSATAKATQWVIGKVRGKHQVHGLFVIVCHIILDVFLGTFLIQRTEFSVTMLAILIGILLFCDGLVQILVAWRTRDIRHRITLYTVGGLTCTVAILAAIFCQTKGMADWLAFLIGIKLTMFGGMLIYVAVTATEGHTDQIYGAPKLNDVEKIPGEAYAVFIGNAFHLGVYVGDDRVVDFRDTNLVYEVTWEQFLLGRQPQHWEYPDLQEEKPEDICEFALGQVGKTIPYNFLKFNCEHFAIWCKSLGKMRASRFAQVNAAYENVVNRPILGTFAEIYSRVMELLAFKVGGVFGKQASLWLRQQSALVSRWLLSGRMKQQMQTETEDVREKQE